MKAALGFVDPHGAVALHVAVTRAPDRVRPRLANLAAHRRCRLTISRMVSTECLCWVIPWPSS